MSRSSRARRRSDAWGEQLGEHRGVEWVLMDEMKIARKDMGRDAMNDGVKE
jgi:hypothetical protein